MAYETQKTTYQYLEQELLLPIQLLILKGKKNL